jgi:electron transfer flavoprotein alpha/beta subunit
MSGLAFVLLEDERDLGLVTMATSLGETIALSCAPLDDGARVDTLLRRAIGAGAKRAVRICDSVLVGADYLATAHVLACAVRHLIDAPGSPSSIVVLAGDRGRGAVGPAVAERLAVAHLGAVRRVSVEGERFLVDRQCGVELRRFVGTAPVVLAVAPVPPSDAAAASDASLESLSLETLQITAPELQYRRRFRPVVGAGPSPRPHLVSNVEHLVDRLRRDGLWPVPHKTGEGDA